MATPAEWPRPARRRTLPPDAPSLDQMVRAVHAKLVARAAHCKAEPHDVHARRGFQTLFEQRADAWRRLSDVALDRALMLAAELGLRPPTDTVASEVRP